MRARALIALMLAAAAACTSSSGSSSSDAGPAPCPNDLPDSCPNPPPSYMNGVAAIIDAKCNVCHANGGPGQSTEDLSTYDKIHSRRGPMLNQVYTCLMPPPDGGPLTPDERKQLLGWLVCEAPDN
jgi:uncharacterized membrane protein